MKTIAFTPGEPAGIGFDLLLKIAPNVFPEPVEFLVFADPLIVQHRAEALSLDVTFDSHDRLFINQQQTQFVFSPITCPKPDVIGFQTYKMFLIC